MLTRLLNLFRPRVPTRPYRLFQIEPTLECSLTCVMCPWTALRPPQASMEWRTFERIIPYLPLTESVDLTGGGEPLRQPRLLDMLRTSKQAGCQVGFSTNAALLTPHTSQALVEAGLDWLAVSMDAATPVLYERIRQGARFANVTGNLAALADLKRSRGLSAPRLILVFVVMTGEQQNYHELPDFIDLARLLGVEQVIAKNLDVILKPEDDQRRIFTHAGGSPNSPAAEIQQAFQEAQHRASETGINLRLYNLHPHEQTICEHDPLHSLFFNWEGWVSPCITLSYAEERIFAGQPVHVPCQRFGNINTQSLDEIWNARPYHQFRQQFAARQAAEQHATIDHLLGGPECSASALPPAPEGCRTCYYLYGI